MKKRRWVFLVDRSGRFDFVPASRLHSIVRWDGSWSVFMSVRLPQGEAPFGLVDRLYLWAVRNYGF